MSEQLITRAQILIANKRFQEANDLLKDILSREPNNVQSLAMLAEVKLELDNVNDAEKLIDSAISLSPDNDALYFVKARTALHKQKYDEAEKWLEQAIAIDPYDADYFALYAYIKLTRKQYAKALELANEALEINPENILGLNTRSTALLKLDKKEESYSTIEGALAQDPNNAYTHSNYGWSLLEKGDHKKALVHFREALKNNPNFAYAQSGMAEALKARYLFYRLFLKYSFWIGNLTAKYQWGVIIGFYIATRALRALANSNETLQLILTPVIILLALIAFSTWIITPVSNLFLRLNPYGKYLLSKKEVQSSTFTGVSFLIFLAGLSGYAITGAEQCIMIAAFGFAMMVPLSVMFSPSKKNSLAIYAAGMFCVGTIAIIHAFISGEIFNPFSVAFVIGFVAFQWIANFLVIKASNF